MIPFRRVCFVSPKAGLVKEINLQPLIQMRTIHGKSTPSAGPIKAAKNLPVINPHAAGIDLGNTQHFVCVPPDSVPEGQSCVRSFGVFNPDLDQMVQWLKQSGVKTVALESTGVMWIPVYQKLEAAGFAVVLANTKTLKHVPGRKSDVLDCQWQQQLHSYGLLNGSFRPADQICRLRTLMRQRENLGRSAARETQHMQKALQEMGVHLHVVVSDVTGDTGLRIIDAILAGERDPKALVELRDWRCRKSTVEQMKAALQGNWREELLFVLEQSRQAYQFYEKQRDAVDQKIMTLLAEIAPAPAVPAPPVPVVEESTPAKKTKPAKRKSSGKGGNPLPRDIRPELAQIYGVDLTQIPGLNAVGVLMILSELGGNLGRWRNGDALASWLGLCPGTKISGGKVLSSRTPHVINRVSVLLRLSALAIGRTETCLGHFYRRLKARHGAPKAMTATARKLAVLIHHLATNREAYAEPDTSAYEERIQKQKLLRLNREAVKLGFRLVPQDDTPAADSIIVT